MTVSGGQSNAPDPTAIALKREETRNARRIGWIALAASITGALVTSIFTYFGLAQQFANQRTAQIDDTRRSAYIEYLQVIQKAYLAGAGTVDEKDLQTKEAVVLLLAGSEVRVLVPELTKDALNVDGTITADSYTAARNNFIEAAQREREQAAQVKVIPWK